jgi:hypothetical protein
MGETAAETVREIEETRDRLDSEIHELEERLPPARVTKRVIGVAAGGAVLWFVVRRFKSRRDAKAAKEASRAMIQVLPERTAKELARMLEEGRWKPWAATAAGIWLFLRLTEIRQLRRMNRALRASSV